ncbi:hypothetical protein IWQ57_003726 [Coemansia nantahalensis]|uniref:Uncharacterized protein n=1 Tax=Coemansia nantahalensis TaxID=2789366 RepID=A0ACC1JV68_9FUNG|nr:hypothetical protein IWQ57_003726 [Coemansia nantahalensis]
MARELDLVPDTRRQLEALQAEAAALRPVLVELKQLYGVLAAATAGAGAGDLVQREAAHRQARHSSYEQIQRDLDAQYAEACRASARQRAASAARSFERDMDDYRRGSTPARRITQAGSAAAGGGGQVTGALHAPRDPARRDPPAFAVLGDEDYEAS